jgi:hypothetical protein
LVVVWFPTTIDAVPDFVLSSVDVAVIVTVPATVGVNTPEDVIVPSDAAHETAELYDPIPCTDAMQVEVCVVRMVAGEQSAATDVIEGVCGAVPPPPPPPPQAVRKSVTHSPMRAPLAINRAGSRIIGFTDLPFRR